jgi:hypothetical protein
MKKISLKFSKIANKIEKDYFKNNFKNFFNNNLFKLYNLIILDQFNTKIEEYEDFQNYMKKKIK